MAVSKKLIILVAPLLLSPAFLFLITEGILSFGAGEKDVFLVVPWVIWSVLFLIVGVALWKKIQSIRIWVVKSFLYSIGALIGVWLSLFLYLIIAQR